MGVKLKPVSRVVYIDRVSCFFSITKTAVVRVCFFLLGLPTKQCNRDVIMRAVTIWGQERSRDYDVMIALFCREVFSSYPKEKLTNDLFIYLDKFAQVQVNVKTSRGNYLMPLDIKRQDMYLP